MDYNEMTVAEIKTFLEYTIGPVSNITPGIRPLQIFAPFSFYDEEGPLTITCGPHGIYFDSDRYPGDTGLTPAEVIFLAGMGFYPKDVEPCHPVESVRLAGAIEGETPAGYPYTLKAGARCVLAMNLPENNKYWVVPSPVSFVCAPGHRDNVFSFLVNVGHLVTEKEVQHVIS